MNEKKSLMHNKTILFLIGACFVFLVSCQPRQERTVNKAFYYWKSVWALTSAEKAALDSLHIRKLYVKYFDVDWDVASNQPMPKASLQDKTTFDPSLEIVPTVYVVNKSLLNLADSLVPALARKIGHKIEQTSLRLGNPKVQEVQLDCDWTEKSRDKYFRLLQTIRQQLKEKHIQLSVTIRLHQVKYYKRTGIPPVDRGMLMFYNMGAISQLRTKNSIFDPQTAKEYLYNFDEYPLSLDVALPLFSWGVLIRQNKAIALVNELTREELKKNHYFQAVQRNIFKVVGRTVLRNQVFVKGDIIRVEEITPALCLEAAELIEPYLKNDTLSVALYHLNELTLKKYDQPTLEKIYRVFY
jgi:hypothetical protein